LEVATISTARTTNADDTDSGATTRGDDARATT
jgi:hypothetical protein